MNFNFTEEQILYRDSISRFIRDRYDLDARNKIVNSELGMSKENWSLFSELGFLAIPFESEYGGLDGSSVDVMVIMEELGRGLVVEPYFSSIILSGGLLSNGGSQEQKAEMIPKITSGELILATAFAEPQSRYNEFDIKTTAAKGSDGYTLNGKKCVVWGGPWADTFVVTTRTAGGQGDKSGITLFLVDKKTKGLEVQDYATIDGGRASELVFNNVKVSSQVILGEVDEGGDLVESVFDSSRAALCSEAVGIMRALHETTLEYAKMREQFGTPIGSFQVIQHRLVDMLIASEEAVSLSYLAALKLDDSTVERQKSVSAAKAKIGQSGKYIGQEAVQIHGGMGMTDELIVGHYFKRLTMIDISLGNQDYHLDRFAKLTQ